MNERPRPNQQLRIIQPTPAAGAPLTGSVLLFKPPFFTPWTPPLGIAILKSFIERHGFRARCVDYNTDAPLWDTHHRYFAALLAVERVSINDGYSKLWWVLNAHMLAVMNGADRAACRRVLEAVIPLYGIPYDRATLETLLEVVEAYFARLGTLLERLDLSDVGVVGLSTYTTSLASSLFIARWVKRRHPHIRTVLGGGVFADDLALGSDNLETLVRDYPEVDHVIVGEGELLLLALLRGELADRRVVSIADIRGMTLPMSEVPVPDFSDVDAADYFHLTIEGARSCPFQCSFCSETIQWGEYRKKPVELFAAQVAELAERYGNRAFFLGDSLMNPYLPAFARELLGKDIRIQYDGYLRADRPVGQRDRALEWARSGLYRVRIGVESASRRVLELMQKKTTPETIGAALRALSAAGIRTTTYWITGFPGETESDFQETLDFIREHHRFIYELEAHPYYYYPYGQVGSRLYQCEELYPREVTDVTRFKVWEIIGADPAREERYDRLRRISRLASKLGIFNIYTMADRYAAEERWLRLHPLAAPVFDEGRPRRSPAAPVPSMPAPVWPAQAADAVEESPLEAVWCLRAAVTEPLDAAVLRSALGELVRHSEMLQVTLRDGRYVPASVAADPAGMVHLVRCEDDDPEQEVRRCAERLAREMRPDAPACIRLAQVECADGAGEVLLCVHRAIMDGRSAALLLEDLFRAYQQIRAGHPLDLLPVGRSYSELAPPTGGGARLAPAQRRASARSTTLHLPPQLGKRLCDPGLAERGWLPGDVLLGALLALPGMAGEGGIDVTIDLRWADAALERTLGPLTRVASVPADVFAGASDVARAGRAAGMLARLAHDLRESGPGSQTGPSSLVLLDLERLPESPWLGGIDWTPRGFVSRPAGLTPPYHLEIAPTHTPQGVLIHLGHEAEASDLVEMLSSSLPGSIASVLDACDQYAEGRDFWREEFDAPVPDPGPAFGRAGGARRWASILHPAVAPTSPALALAAFSVVLSRISGQEDLAIGMVSRDRILPLRLRPAWHLPLQAHAERVQERIALSLRYRDQVAGAAERLPPLPFAFGVGGSDGAPEEPAEALVLMVRVLPEGFHFVYDGARLERRAVHEIGAWMERVLEQIARARDVRVGDVRLEESRTDPLTELAADAFRF